MKKQVFLLALVITIVTAVEQQEEASSRQLFSSGLFAFLFPNVKSSIGTISLPNGNSIPGLTFKRIRPQNPLGPVTVKSVIFTASGNPNVTGTLYMSQNSRSDNIFGIGILRGLIANEAFNIHVRTNADITSNCGLQGAVFAPDQTALQGQIFQGTADVSGRATFTIQELPPSVVTFFTKNTVLNRSIRVVSGADPNAGVIRGCGEIEPTPDLQVTYG